MPRKWNGLLKSNPRMLQRLDRLAVEPEDLGLREEQDRGHLREGHRRQREVETLQAERRQRHRHAEGDREQRPRPRARRWCRTVGAHCRNANAPAPTNVIWASEICFDQPVRGMSDTMMSMVSSASVSVRTSVRWNTSPRTATTMNRIPIPKMALGIDGMRGAT